MAEIKVEIAGDVLRASVGATVLIIEKVGSVVQVNAVNIHEMTVRDSNVSLGDGVQVSNMHLHGNSVLGDVKDAN